MGQAGVVGHGILWLDEGNMYKIDALDARIPAEWEPRRGTLLAWPTSSRPWSSEYRALVETYVTLITALREVEEVTILVQPHAGPSVTAVLGGIDEHVHIEELPTNDIWMRDCGPIGVEADTGPRSGEVRGQRITLLDGQFNGWGGKFPCELDRLLPTVLARRWGLPRYTLPITIEGGAIEANGCGDLITTASVLLNPNRNAGYSKADVEAILGAVCGARVVHWLPRGLSGDHTDGHVDNVARFITEEHVVYAWEDVPQEHPNAEVFSELAIALGTMNNARGNTVDATPLPVPTITNKRGTLLPASYCNFYTTRESLLVPQFQDTRDAMALGILAELVPHRRVIGIPALPLLHSGGTLHCITQPIQ